MGARVDQDRGVAWGTVAFGSRRHRLGSRSQSAVLPTPSVQTQGTVLLGRSLAIAPARRAHRHAPPCQDHEPLWYDAQNEREKPFTAITDFSRTALPRTFLIRTSDPTQIDHPDLRGFAVQACSVAKLEETVGVLEELVVDLVDEEQRSDREPWEEDPLEVALSVLTANFEAADQELEARVTDWLAQDPEHWPILRLVVLDPWQEQTEQVRGGAATVKRLAYNRPGVGQRLNSHRFGNLDSDHRCRVWTGPGIEAGLSRASRRIWLCGGRSG